MRILIYNEIPFKVNIIDFGIYSAKIGHKEKAEATSLGNISISGDYQQIMSTDKVEGMLGISFGIKYQLIALNKEQEWQLFKLRTKIIHPEITNPATLEKNTIDEWDEGRYIGDVKHTGFRFEHDWEIKEGRWKIQLWFNDHLLASKDFYVTR